MKTEGSYLGEQSLEKPLDVFSCINQQSAQSETEGLTNMF